MLPPLIAAVPIKWRLGSPSVWTPTFTTVWIPALYPEPLLAILTAVTEPAAETVTVPPAATSGWYPNPLTVPAETIKPPSGISLSFGSWPLTLTLVPVKFTVDTPANSWML